MYGAKPVLIGEKVINCNEMLFYQYLPIKLANSTDIKMEDRLTPFKDLVGQICCDFVAVYGLTRFRMSYIYLTAKVLYQSGGCSYNRLGWHSDGFMTDDINYIWCDKNPTIFNCSNFNITQDDKLSMVEMSEQALPENDFSYPCNSILRLDQYNIHKVADKQDEGVRQFAKVSFSYDRYDLIGNAHNYLLDYNWEMKPRKLDRNIPQSKQLTQKDLIK